jgi:hypothetical protein
MSLSKLKKSLDDTKEATHSLTDQIIQKSKLWKQIAEGPMGGYLDTLTRMLQALHDPAFKDFQNISTIKLVELQNLLHLAGYGNFDVGDFKNEFERIRREANAPPRRSQQRAPSGGGSTSGGMVIRINTRNGQPTIDILNDNGTAGAGGTNWYKPDDPDWLKIQQSQGTIKGH